LWENRPINTGRNKKNKVIVDYNNSDTGGVDKLDQMTEPYLSTHKTIKWYKKVFQHLLDVNSGIVQNKKSFI